jgi:hypothetical protein
MLRGKGVGGWKSRASNRDIWRSITGGSRLKSCCRTKGGGEAGVEEEEEEEKDKEEKENGKEKGKEEEEKKRKNKSLWPRKSSQTTQIFNLSNQIMTLLHTQK